MRTISGLVMAIGLCLVVLFGEASARGFGGGFGGGFRGGYGGFGGGDGAAFRAGEGYGARRAIDRGFYAGGWGMDESDEATSDDGDSDDSDNGDGDQ
jgi:hypothetical protein